MDSSLQDIERATGALAPDQREELSLWLDRQYPQPIDEKLEADLHAGLLNGLIDRALSDHKARITRSL